MNTQTNQVNAAISALVNVMSKDQKEMLMKQLTQEDDVQGRQTDKTNKIEPVVVKYEKPLDPIEVQKAIHTASRLAEAQKRRVIVERVLMKLFKDRIFTVSELEETLAPVLADWTVDKTAELSNILKAMDAKMVGKAKREGKGRAQNLWSIAPDDQPKQSKPVASMTQ